MPQLPIPTIGRIVLYRGRDGLIRSAIVTHVHGPLCINVHVFGHTSADPEAGTYTSVTHAQPDQEPGCFPSWHWMPYQLQTAGQRHTDAPASQTVQDEIAAEMARAVAKFPTWPTDPLHALAVLGEEFGELTKAVLQGVYEPHKNDPGAVRKEAIQTAAMALRFARSLDAYRFTRCPQHEQA